MATDQGPPADDPRFAELRRHGDPGLRNELVELHLSLARAFARRYARRGVALDDLEQVARLALVKAVDRFDPEVGVRFPTFASRTIDGELKRYFRDTTWSVRVPRTSQDLGLAVRSATEELTQRNARSPTVQELAEHVGADIDEVIAAMEAGQALRADSLDSPTTDRDAPSLGEALGGPEAGFDAIEEREVVADLLRRLPERERRLVQLRFFDELNQREIAARLGISQMHVSRLLRRALATLRAAGEP